MEGQIDMAAGRWDEGVGGTGLESGTFSPGHFREFGYRWRDAGKGAEFVNESRVNSRGSQQSFRVITLWN